MSSGEDSDGLAAPRTVPDFVGAGWSFPPRLDVQGRIALSRGEDDIEDAIQVILKTHKGERLMRPEFGSELHLLVFQPCDAATAGQARRYVLDALSRWEPRIDQVEVAAMPDPDNPSRLSINVSYRVRTTNALRNLVFPFYVIPGEE